MSAATTTAKSLTASLEDYLEAVLRFVQRDGVARARDIASALDVHMPSVTTALKALAGRKLVNYEPYQFITLTEEGLRAAEEINRRHDLLRRFLRDILGLDAVTADENACRMEHAVDEAVLARLGEFARFVHGRGTDKGWAAEFAEYIADVERARSAGPAMQDETDLSAPKPAGGETPR